MGKFEPSQPPLPDLFEMRNIEYIIKDTFGDGAWREVFGELTFRSRE